MFLGIVLDKVDRSNVDGSELAVGRGTKCDQVFIPSASDRGVLFFDPASMPIKLKRELSGEGRALFSAEG